MYIKDFVLLVVIYSGINVALKDNERVVVVVQWIRYKSVSLELR